MERPWFLIFLGLVGMAGCAVLAAGTAIAPSFVPRHDPIADTISDLAAGNSEIIMDVALYGFAAGLVSTSLAAAHAHLGRAWWSAGVMALALLAAIITVIGARNEYGDSDTGGVVVHIELVYGLGVLFLAAPLCMVRSLHDCHPLAGKLLLALAALWGLTSPGFFLLPTSIDGLYERALGIVACAMILTLCTVFVRRGRDALGRQRRTASAPGRLDRSEGARGTG